MMCSTCKKDVDRYANGKRCRDCYNAYMKAYMAKKYRQRRDMAILVLGGKCVDCGSIEKLELDHILPSAKILSVSSRTWSKLAYWTEVMEKCALRCQRCHRIKSANEAFVPHGGGASGRRNCPCLPCKERKREYMREYMKKRRGPIAQSGRAEDS
jgi:hypothetical protein